MIYLLFPFLYLKKFNKLFMKKFFNFFCFILIGLCLYTAAYAQEQDEPNVSIKGRLSNFGSTIVVEDFSELYRMIPASFNKVIKPESDSTFSLQFKIEKPGYFRIGRNKLYLTPGDDMDVMLNHNNSNLSTFKGKGSVANNYLINTPFPKGGSYIEAGRNLKESPAETLSLILNNRKQKDKELMALKGVSAEFKRLELARNKADVIKSISSTLSYASVTFRKKPKEFLENYLLEFEKISTPIKKALLKNFIDPSLLQLEVYRDIYNDLLKENPVNTSKKQVLEDWYKANLLASNKIKPLNDKLKLPEFIKSADSIKTKKYRNVLNQLIADKMKFGVGDEAIDLVFNTTDGKNVSLSSLKGKVIYLDLWATWCGPCLAAMPHFEKLKEKYAANNDVALVSLSVDDNDDIWLRNLEKRKPAGIQWRIDRPKLADYDIQSIPRYILIDKNFKISEMHAPEAADPLVINAIDKLLTN